MTPALARLSMPGFAELQKIVAAEVYEPESCLLGPLVLPLGHPDLAAAGEADLVDPATTRLDALGRCFPDVIPPGFVVTAAGCQRLFLTDDVQNEIQRRVQAAGGFGPKHLARLSDSLGALVESTPLPAELAEAVRAALRELRARCQGPMRLLLRGRLWPLHEEKNEDHGLLLWGPSVSLDAPDAEILRALHITLARKERAQALIYRRARGLADAGAGICVTCLAVAEGSRGGLAHTGNPLRPLNADVYVYGCEGLPQDMEYSDLPVDLLRVSRTRPHAANGRELHDPQHPVLDDATAVKVAELALSLEKNEGRPMSLTWVRSPAGDLRLLLARPMILADSADDLHDPLPLTTDPGELPEPLLTGGVAANPGRVCGPTLMAVDWDDVRRFPQGGILVVPNDSYTWASLIDRIAGLIAEQGLVGSRLGSLAREFGKPAVFGMAGAMRCLQSGQRITLCADSAGQSRVYPGSARRSAGRARAAA